MEERLIMSSCLALPRILSDGCVLQRGEQTAIWGWGLPGTTISVRLQGNTADAVVDEQGSWQTSLGPLTAGGPFELSVSVEGREQEKLSRTCYVGDVYLCSGQSNMELTMEAVRRRFPKYFDTEDTLLRTFKVVPDAQFEQPLEDHAHAVWSSCNPETINSFSALAFFFGRRLRMKLGVPVGLLDVSLGGSPIESWIDKESLRNFPAALKLLEGYETNAAATAKHEKSLAALQEWHDELEQKTWDERIVKDSEVLSWKPVNLPVRFDSLSRPGFNGLMYLRKFIELPPYTEFNEPAELHMGTILDADITYVNGKRIGTSEHQYLQRDYEIPPEILHSGVNEIVMSITVEHGAGRVTEGKARTLDIGALSFNLNGQWDYALAKEMNRQCPQEDFIQWKPAVLYNGMLHPCLPMTTRAILWYQGESNTGDPDKYEEYLTTLVSTWRAQMGRQTEPFYIVQLPGFQIDNPEDGGWAGVRNAELHAALDLENVETIVTLDCGDWNDLHPTDKLTIGERLAQAALAKEFEQGTWNPCLPTGWSIDEVNDFTRPRFWRVEIDFAGSLESGQLHTQNGTLPDEFEFAWANGSHRKVPASVEGTKVRMEIDAGPKPDIIRYAYSSCPQKGLLCDDFGVPITPFLIDIKQKKLFA
jgi:sialate O-acetylesterase